jgi:hypothetical protein
MPRCRVTDAQDINSNRQEETEMPNYEMDPKTTAELRKLEAQAIIG